ncbi:MAG: hypothetical protein RIQ88_259 [Actinomycetota bacterium]|jgi:Dual specificity phosphatase, catalytic domain
MTEPYYPETIWSEIEPGLFQGGTHEDDELGAFLRTAPATIKYYEAEDYIRETQVSSRDFDTVISAFNQSNPCGYGVKELRFSFFDGNMSDFDPERDLFWLVREAHQDWKAGKRVLIRCQAGLNRSGLITALVLIRDGHSPEQAIDKIRKNRGEGALRNEKFVNYLTEFADLEYWRKS